MERVCTNSRPNKSCRMPPGVVVGRMGDHPRRVVWPQYASDMVRFFRARSKSRLRISFSPSLYTKDATHILGSPRYSRTRMHLETCFMAVTVGCVQHASPFTRFLVSQRTGKHTITYTLLYWYGIRDGPHSPMYPGISRVSAPMDSDGCADATPRKPGNREQHYCCRYYELFLRGMYDYDLDTTTCT